MNTPLGKIEVYVNRAQIDYTVVELPSCARYFYVDKRVKLICDIPYSEKQRSFVKCSLALNENMDVDCGADTGENLALIDFEWDNFKLCIGTLGDIPGVRYYYQDNSLALEALPQTRQVVFYVAWIKMKDCEKESIYPWLAADPAYDRQPRQ